MLVVIWKACFLSKYQFDKKKSHMPITFNIFCFMAACTLIYVSAQFTLILRILSYPTTSFVTHSFRNLPPVLLTTAVPRAVWRQYRCKLRRVIQSRKQSMLTRWIFYVMTMNIHTRLIEPRLSSRHNDTTFSCS